MIEEAAHHVVRQIEDIEPIDWRLFLGAGKRQKKSKCVSIASLCVPAQVAFLYQVIEEEALHPRAK
jgi:hypothetical protein